MVALRVLGVRDPRADDPQVEKLTRVLNAIAVRACPPGFRLGGGGGYGDPARFPGERADVACILIQKNEIGSGDLADCDEVDREVVRRALRACPIVEAFHVGKLHSGDEYDPDETARVTTYLTQPESL